MNKIFLLIFLLIIIPSVSSIEELPTVTQSVCIDLPQSDVAVLTQNITFIKQPNGNNQLINSPMTQFAQSGWNYTYCNTSQIGQYQVNGCSEVDCWNYFFYVTPNGDTMSTAKSVTYSLMLAIVILLFFGFAYGFTVTPFDNNRNQDQEVISINYKKYFKVFCFAMAYSCLSAIFFFAWNISWAFLNFGGIANIFYFFYYLLSLGLKIMILLIPLAVGLMIRNDKRIQKLLDRGIYKIV